MIKVFSLRNRDFEYHVHAPEMSPSHYANNADTLFHRKIIKTDKNYKSAYRFQATALHK